MRKRQAVEIWTAAVEVYERCVGYVRAIFEIHALELMAILRQHDKAGIGYIFA